MSTNKIQEQNNFSLSKLKLSSRRARNWKIEKLISKVNFHSIQRFKVHKTFYMCCVSLRGENLNFVTALDVRREFIVSNREISWNSLRKFLLLVEEISENLWRFVNRERNNLDYFCFEFFLKVPNTTRQIINLFFNYQPMMAFEI